MFLTKFSPTNQVKMCGHEVQCLVADTPSVVAVKHAYGDEITTKWLATHLIELNEYCGVKDKMTIPQIDQLSRILISQYGYLKPQEFMLFFLKFKAGEYGKLYGVIDPIVISDSFSKFLDYRKMLLERAELERIRREREEQDKAAENLAISYNEYIKRKQNEIQQRQ